VNKISERHHYIPEFYTKGFLNNDGKLYVYDKVKDEIRKNAVSPKQIFFEWNRNSFMTDRGEENGMLEDLYSKLDCHFAKIIQEFRDKPNSKELLATDNIALLRFFIINLFWRIPKNDISTSVYHCRSVKNSEFDEKLKYDHNFIKIMRPQFPFHIIRNFANQERRNCRYQLFEFKKGNFLIGDCPIVFKTEPKKVDEFIYGDYIIPISSKRVFRASEDDLELSFSFENTVILNAIIIDQSENYVCGPNKVFLEQSIKYWRFIKSTRQLPYLSKKIFRN